MVHQLMEAYGWTYDHAMSRTLPQILMLTHASWVSSERMEKRMDANRKAKEAKKVEEDDDPIVFRGKRLSELTEEDEIQYYGDINNM